MTSNDISALVRNPTVQARVKYAFITAAIAILSDATRSNEYQFCNAILGDKVSIESLIIGVMGDVGIMQESEFANATDIQIANRVSGIFPLYAKAYRS